MIKRVAPDFYEYRLTDVKRKNSQRIEKKIVMCFKDHSRATPQAIAKSVGQKFVTTALIRQRAKDFLNNLRGVFEREHGKYLQENNISEEQNNGDWHSGFNVVNVQIPRSPLPAVDKTKSTELQAFLHQGKGTYLDKKEVKERMAKELSDAEKAGIGRDGHGALSFLKRKASPKQSPSMSNPAMDLPDHLKHLDPKILARIRGKSKKKKIIKSVAKDEVKEVKKRLEHLGYLVNLIRSVMTSNKRSATPMMKLKSTLAKKHRDLHGPAQVREQLVLLHKVSEKYILKAFMLKVTSRKTEIFKVNMKFSVKKFLAKVKTYIEGLETS